MNARIAAAVASLILAGCATVSEPRTVTVLSGGAVKSALTDAIAAWERASGHKVAATFAPAGDMRKKIAAGEVYDIVVIPVENLPDLERAGAIDPASRRDLAGVSMGAAVRAGARVPDISTPEALRKTLTEAKSLTYMDPAIGTSGRHFDEAVLPKLGVRDEVRAKTQFGKGGYIAEKVASGEVEIAFHNLTELKPVAGVTLVGPLPDSLQKVTIYSGTVMKAAKQPREASQLLEFLRSAEGRKAFADRGYSAP
jgi:molybdate transport system substrate-binding protein